MIASSYGISLAQLEQANQFINPYRLQVNQFLRIPLSEMESPLSRSSIMPNPGVIEVEDTSSTATYLTPAVINPLEMPSEAPTLPTKNPNDYYVDNLKNEIASLRQKYRQNQSNRPTHFSANLLSAPADASTSPKPASSDISFQQYTDTLEAKIQKLRERQRSIVSQLASESNSTATASAQYEQKRVATAAISSETYAPAIKPIMVSPDLPLLNGVDKYLPEKSVISGYIWPAKGELTSGYGWRWGRMHNGIDIAAPIGTPIVAAASGVVIYAGWNDGGYGNLVEILHPDGSISRYAHNERILVRQGQSVEQGQQIAEMGSTGFSTGPHCHFEIHLPGQGAQNPLAFLPRQ
ncbi:MAG TPA: peptidoglycan DD-metalloendopeptidase family protein [Oscillatoriaceae cyanobacterium M7585_C2015_266]|nr:peptidoglycan DD-metalloendopeptidase family protein [Oscillatoriaceae cyanobacterium M7585_C2015_266]